LCRIPSPSTNPVTDPERQLVDLRIDIIAATARIRNGADATNEKSARATRSAGKHASRKAAA
jgi:hypothetical protein